jgi:hypothetical protein
MTKARDLADNALGSKPKLIDAAGDLIYGTGSDAATRLGIGTAGQVLQVNSGATAPEWAPASVSSPPVIPLIGSGIYVGTTRTTVTSNAATNNTTYYCPIYLPTCTLDRIGFRATTYSVTGDVRLGIYQNSATTNKPSTLILDAGTVSVTTNSTYEITINQAVTAGWYWLAINKNGGTFNLYNATASIGYPIFATNAANSLNEATSQSFTAMGYSETGITGAFANAGTIAPLNSPFIAAVRIA